eukprot:1564190-Lingulodinium_polyedra.AAC.1
MVGMCTRVTADSGFGDGISMRLSQARCGCFRRAIEMNGVCASRLGFEFWFPRRHGGGPGP